jgi:SAM-dependent methyltransferase
VEVTEVTKLAKLEDRHWWYGERRVLLSRMILARFPGGTEGLVAVDIGAAAGGNTRVMRDLGMYAVPVEFGAAGAKLAHGRGLPALQADAVRLPMKSATIDLVVAFDVLEHIVDDAAALREVERVLRPGGCLLVTVPADMDLWSAHDEAVGHVRRYSYEALSDVTTAAGLQVDSIRSWNVILKRVVALRRRRIQGSALGDVHPLLNRALGAIVAAERRLPRLNRRPGVSLIMIASRRGMNSR